MVSEHQDYPHQPGTLPGCPACDRMEAHETWKEIKRGKRCPTDIINEAGLDNNQKRLVELALRAEEEAEKDRLPLVDVLHGWMGVATDKVKAQIAEWVTPEYAHEFTGSREERDKYRHAAEQRAFDRRDDKVLEVASHLGLDDHSLSARQIRETAASIREHRENRHRQLMYQAQDAEDELLEKARALYDQRNDKRRQAEELAKQENWDAAALASIEMRKLDEQANDLVGQSIDQKNLARHHELQAGIHRLAQDHYENSETYRRDREEERAGR